MMISSSMLQHVLLSHSIIIIDLIVRQLHQMALEIYLTNNRFRRTSDASLKSVACSNFFSFAECSRGLESRIASNW